MKGKWLGVLALVVAGGVLLSVSSCGRSQELVSISVQPAVENFGASSLPVPDDAGLSVQLRALGSYIHPPVTKDITTEVTWTSNTPQMVTVNPSGLITVTGDACGGTLVSATLKTNSSSGGISSSGAVVTGTMTANVICFTGTGGVGLNVSFLGTGSGSVSSSPAGLSCLSTATACNGLFPSGSSVSLTAVPNGTFVGWAGCDGVSGSGLICTVNNLTVSRTVTATFD